MGCQALLEPTDYFSFCWERTVKQPIFSGSEVTMYGFTFLMCSFRLTVVIMVPCHLVAPETT